MEPTFACQALGNASYFSVAVGKIWEQVNEFQDKPCDCFHMSSIFYLRPTTHRYEKIVYDREWSSTEIASNDLYSCFSLIYGSV